MLNPCDGAFLTHLAGLLPPGRIRVPEPRDLEEPRNLWLGQAGGVAMPHSTEEAALILREASAARVGLVPISGGTGLVAGQVMTAGALPLLVSLERMSRIRAVLPEENLILAEGGAILADVQRAAREAGRLFPLSLASEGSCRIGGNLATNAGGVQVLRYGNARDLCLGIEAVLPDGSVLNGLRRLRKDNTGYDLRHLLIGSEGTLGIITAAVLRLFPLPARQGTAFLVVPDPKAAVRLLGLAQSLAGEAISAFELMNGQGFRFMAETMPQIRQPWPEAPDWAVLIDLCTEADRDPTALLEAIFAEAFDAGLVLDGLVAGSEAQRQEFWAVREMQNESNRRIGTILSNDVSLPLAAIPEFIETASSALAKVGPLRINCFGHLGDGNLHFNLFPEPGGRKEDWADRRERLERIINDLLAEREGSFSAEHGIGRAKVGELERYGDPARLAAMRAIKAALDPFGIMNPGAVLRG